MSLPKPGWLLPAGAAGAAAMATIGTIAAAGSRALRRDSVLIGPPGATVSVGGRDVHVRVTGEPSDAPTVVLEAGMGCPLQQWSWVQQELSGAGYQVLSYDRAGLGWSQPVPGSRDAAAMAEELHDLLAALDMGGRPLVLVGHSVGGLLVRVYADRHPRRVRGLVLVDATHPDELVRSRKQQRGLPWLEQSTKSSYVRSLLGIQRLLPPEQTWSTLPAQEWLQLAHLQSQAGGWRTTLRELEAWKHQIPEQVRQTQLPDGVRLAVVTSGVSIRNDPVHEKLQGELAALRTGATHEIIRPADHYGLIVDPAHAKRVAAIVAGVAGRASTGTAHRPQTAMAAALRQGVA